MRDDDLPERVVRVIPINEAARPLTLDTFRACAEAFPALYLKPDDLQKGQGVFRVRRQDTAWVLEQSGKDGHQEWTCHSAEELLALLPQENPYLVQEAIDLATYLGNIYDFRALVQKDVEGTWQVTGVVARVAPEDGVITSPRSGGLISPPLPVLTHSFGEDAAKEILANLYAVSLRLAAAMEEGFGPCLELGLDLGVTKDGRVRLIEVNGRPLKVSLIRLNDPEINARIHRYPIYRLAALDMVGLRREESRCRH